ncbi:MAG: UDP-N-acetylmuramate--L-alanine ligase [Bacteroidota bacterium]
MELSSIQTIYFLGIGGIGMSALARYFHREGKNVLGYDRTSSIVTEGLEDEGMTIFYVLDPSHIQEADLMVYTPAISQDNVEYQAALRAGIPILKRSQILGLISEQYRTLAVAGTHGKTTTSSMLAHLLRHGGVDATAFLGGIARNLEGNFAYGESDWLVVEADEFDRSFLTLKPEYAIVTSMDPDHLDIYGTPDEMANNYRAFGDLSQQLLVHHSLGEQGWTKPLETFGIEVGDYQARNLRFGDLETVFDFRFAERQIENLRLPFPGRHNVLNMVSAMALALKAGMKAEKLPTAVSSFAGIYRRFERQHHSPRLTYIDDYAHHPTEIAAAMDTARRLFPDRQLVVIFQPHLFSRTRDFADGFREELAKADALLLMDIYPAREEPIEGVSSEMLLSATPSANAKIVTRKDITTQLQQLISLPTILLSLGAGDIDREVGAIRAFCEAVDKEWVQNQESQHGN